MQDYLKLYQEINIQFGEVIKDSLNEKNVQKHAKATSFVDDYEQWISLLGDSYEVILFEEALSEYKAMLLFWSMGLYKYAFMALRGFFELTLFGIELSTNELNYRLWKQGELDLYWSQIIDEANGIFSKQFVNAFQQSFSENAQSMRLMAKSVYRECSEFIHSNFKTTDMLPEKTMFEQKVFDLVASKVETIDQVVTYMFTVRYLDIVIGKNKLSDFEDCIMDNIGFLSSAQLIYR